MSNRAGKAQEPPSQLLSQIEQLKRELREMREELEDTTRGTLALYNEIENKNAELKQQQLQLEEKNTELQKALENLRTSEEARLRAARTAAIGNIVVTYNHEINNPLAIITASLDLLKLTPDLPDEERRKQFAKIERAADRVKDVITKIKQYENLLPKSYINWDMLDLESAKVHYKK